MDWISSITLRGSHVLLEPLSQSHHDDLIDAVKDGELWKLWYTIVPSPKEMRAEIDRRMQWQGDGSMLPFAVVERATGKAVGMTTYLHIDAENRRLEIGATWYGKRVQRTSVNTECKYLLLAHAFETLGCNAVELRTSFFNHPSRRGIERLGAKLDGILRNHMILPNGTLRDTCVYSILVSEWPAAKAHLSWQLHRPRDDSPER